MRALCLLFVLSASSAAHADDYWLQLPGDQHGDEVVAQDGESWLALVRDGDGYRLLQTPLAVMPVADRVFGDDDDEAPTGRRVEASGIDALVFLQGPDLHGGPAPTAGGYTGPTPLEPGAGWSLTLPHGEAANLRLECALRALDETARNESENRHLCLLILERAGIEQTLGVWAGFDTTTAAGTSGISLGDEGQPALLFAGDLDGDGQLDLLLDVSDHYNLNQTVLYLSGAARPDELVRAVALYEQTGC